MIETGNIKVSEMTDKTYSPLKSNTKNAAVPETHPLGDPLNEFLDRVLQALETYSNVHRGSGFQCTGDMQRPGRNQQNCTPV